MMIGTAQCYWASSKFGSKEKKYVDEVKSTAKQTQKSRDFFQITVRESRM
jgi:hypothetical protein